MIKEIRKIALSGAMGTAILAMGNVNAVESLKVYDEGKTPAIDFTGCTPVIKGAVLKTSTDTCLDLGCHGAYEIVSGNISINLQGGTVPYVITQRENEIYFNNPSVMGTLDSNGFDCYVTITVNDLITADSGLSESEEKPVAERYALGIRRAGDDNNYLAILQGNGGTYPSSAVFHITQEDTLKFVSLFSQKKISEELVPVTSETKVEGVMDVSSGELNLSSVFRVVAETSVQAPDVGSWTSASYTASAHEKFFDSCFTNGLYVRIDNGHVTAAKDFDSPSWTVLSGITVSGDTNRVSIAYIEGQYIIYAAGKAYTAAKEDWQDPSKWSSGTTVNNHYDMCTTLNTRLFSVDNNGNASYSLNGANWFKTDEVGQSVDFFTSGNGVMTALNKNGVLSVSERGDQWSKLTSLSKILGTSDISGLAFGNGRFLAVNQSGKIASSVDGSVWEAYGEVGTDGCTDLVFRDGKFYVQANTLLGGEQVYTAPDFPIEVK